MTTAELLARWAEQSRSLAREIRTGAADILSRPRPDAEAEQIADALSYLDLAIAALKTIPKIDNFRPGGFVSGGIPVQLILGTVIGFAVTLGISRLLRSRRP